MIRGLIGSTFSKMDNNKSSNLGHPDRSLRSVFVGNIPYEASEEQLKEIFADVGPVVSFRLVFDRDTGKPKGYGFCEYKDKETAVSAMRNLNGHELNGRQLRVDSAASEKNKEEEMVASFHQEASPYGPPVIPQEAPSAITQAVASLPPEQMFELMKQMKLCIQQNPEEARQMLLQNPQLSYALLQAQVVMKIVSPEIAQAILYRQAEPPQPLESKPVIATKDMHAPPPPPLDMRGQDMRGPSSDIRGPPDRRGPPDDMRGPPDMRGLPDRRGPPDDMRGPPDRRGPPDDLRGPPDRRGPRDMRGPPDSRAPPERGSDFRGDPRGFDRGRGPPDERRGGPPDPRSGSQRGANDRDPRRAPDFDPRRDRSAAPPPAPPPGAPSDDRFAGKPPPQWNKAAQPTPPGNGLPTGKPGPTPPVPPAASDVTPQDQEKAALIMQVLSLTDQQIALLPEDQRQSIMVLKEQIARSSQ